MRRLLPVLASLLVAVATLAACDPVHQDATAALGGEAAGVRKGPLHRPGQPCIVCHDGAIGNPPQFSVAGTILQTDVGPSPAENAAVSLTDSAGKSFTATTKGAGNFYVTPTEFTPTYPMKVAVTYAGVTVKMTSVVGRDGSCANCHADPAGPTSAGHVYIPANGVAP